MPNTFEYATWLAMTALDLLENRRGITQHFNTEYSKEFKKEFPVGDSFNIPFPAQFTSRRGLEYQPQAITRRHATIEMQEPFGVDFEWDSAEAALRAPRGRDKVEKEIIAPAMARMAADIESAAALWAYQHAAGLVGALGTNPTTIDGTSAAARQYMQEMAAPEDDRAIIVPPAVMRLVKKDGLTLTNPAADISKQYRTGIMGQTDGFTWYESMSLYKHTAATWQAAVSITTAPANGATELTLTCTSGDTFKKGDKISIADVLRVNTETKRTFDTNAKTFTITSESQTISGTSAKITVSPAIYYEGPYQNVSQQPAASAALTLWPGTDTPNAHSGLVGLAIPKNAFALVGVPLEEPKGSSVELVAQKRDPDSGVTVRFIRMFDGKSSKMINRFDAFIGFGDFYNDLAVAIACA